MRSFRPLKKFGVETNLDVGEISVEFESGRKLLQIGNGVDVIVVRRIAHRGAVCGDGGECGLDLHHGRGFFGGLLRCVAGQDEHFSDVIDILLADFHEPLGVFDVVVAIGKRQARLSELGDLLGGVLLVLANAETIERRGAALGRELADERGKVAGVLEIADALERRFERFQTLFFNQAGVHAGGIVVAVFLFEGCLGVVGGGVQFLPKQIAVALLKQREGPRPAHLVRRDGIVLVPVAARVLVEVGAGVGGLVDGGGVEAPDGWRGRGLGCVVLRNVGGLRDSGCGGQNQEKCKTKWIHGVSFGKRSQLAGKVQRIKQGRAGQDRICRRQFEAGCIARKAIMRERRCSPILPSLVIAGMLLHFASYCGSASRPARLRRSGQELMPAVG